MSKLQKKTNPIKTTENYVFECQFCTEWAHMYANSAQGGALASKIREIERDINKHSSKKVKVVEKYGQQVQSILTTPDPWGSERCGRVDCLPCTTTQEGDKTHCRSSNVVYQTKCNLCKELGKTTCYIGETSRTLYEREAEHTRDLWGEKDMSHMHEHIKGTHPDQAGARTLQQAAPLFEIKPIKRHPTALSRQLHEAIQIKRAGETGEALNNREEYSHCVIPTLTTNKWNPKPIHPSPAPALRQNPN